MASDLSGLYGGATPTQGGLYGGTVRRTNTTLLPSQRVAQPKPNTKKATVKAPAPTVHAELDPAAVSQFLAGLAPEQQQALLNDPDIGGKLKAAQSGPQSIHDILNPQAAAGAGTETPIIDPMAVQAFFSSTIAPYLQSTGDQMRGTANQYASQMNELLKSGNLPAAYKGVIAASIPQHQQAYNALASALQGSAIAQPQLSALMDAISQAKNAQVKRYYQEQANAALGGGGGGDLATLLANAGIGNQGG